MVFFTKRVGQFYARTMVVVGWGSQDGDCSNSGFQGGLGGGGVSSIEKLGGLGQKGYDKL